MKSKIDNKLVNVTKKKQTHRYVENKFTFTSAEREWRRGKVREGIKRYKILCIK